MRIYNTKPAYYITIGSILLHENTSNKIWFVNNPWSSKPNLYSFDVAAYTEPYVKYVQTYFSNCLDVNKAAAIMWPDGFMH